MRFLFAQGVWQQPEIQSPHLLVCLKSHEETEQTETDQIQKNCGEQSQETILQSYLRNYEQVHRGQKLL